MNPLTDLFRAAASICAGCSLFAFTLWLLRIATAFYAQGQPGPTSRDSARSPFFAPGSSPSPVAGVKSAVTAYVGRLRDRDVPYLRDYLADCRTLLVRAGQRSRTAEDFVGTSLLSSIGMALLASLFSALLQFGLGETLLFAMPPAFLLGFWLPNLALRRDGDDRSSLIDKRLPFATEFILLSMGANLSFDQAAKTYCDQMTGDPLADEFFVMLRELQVSADLPAAIDNLASRVGSVEVSSFALAAVTSLNKGTSPKEVLEVQAEETRKRRYANAESIAKAASVKAALPLMLVILASLILLVGPLMLKALEQKLF